MKIYIQSNRFQGIAAKVSSETFNSFGHSSEIIYVENFNEITKYFGRKYLRKGKEVIFKDDLQSFTLLRFLIPELAKSNDPILIIDPDIFAIKDPVSILKNIKNNQKLYCTFINKLPRTEVMFYNSKNQLWDFEKIIKDLFDFKIDYSDLFKLNFLDHNILGKLDDKYNSLDEIKDNTVLLHTTNRKTQPWKEGLEIDFEIHATKFNILYNTFKKVIGLNHNRNIVGNLYQKHPRNEIIDFIIKAFNNAHKKKIITKKELLNSVKLNYISENFMKKLTLADK